MDVTFTLRDVVQISIATAAIAVLTWRVIRVEREAKATHDDVKKLNEERRTEFSEAVAERDRWRIEKDAASKQRWDATLVLVEKTEGKIVSSRADALRAVHDALRGIMETVEKHRLEWGVRFGQLETDLKALLPLGAHWERTEVMFGTLKNDVATFLGEARGWGVAALRAEMEQAKKDILILRAARHELANELQRIIGRTWKEELKRKGEPKRQPVAAADSSPPVVADDADEET